MGRAESIVETYLCDRVRLMGGITRKLVAQGRNGFPDRTCLFPGARLLFVECKVKGEKPKPEQIEEMRLLRALGFWVAWVDTKLAIDCLLRDFEADDLQMFNKRWPL